MLEYKILLGSISRPKELTDRINELGKQGDWRVAKMEYADSIDTIIILMERT